MPLQSGKALFHIERDAVAVATKRRSVLQTSAKRALGDQTLLELFDAILQPVRFRTQPYTPCILRVMMFHSVLGRFVMVMLGLNVMAVRQMGMVARLLVVAGLGVLLGLMMMKRRMLVVLGSVGVMFSSRMGMLRHLISPYPLDFPKRRWQP